MFEVTRIYRNSANNDLRIDTLYLSQKMDNIVVGANSSTKSGHVYQRELSVIKMYKDTDRVVDSIELIGSFDYVEPSSGNFLYATWESPSAQLDMSDLPGLGDTV